MDTPYALVSLEVVGSTQDEARARRRVRCLSLHLDTRQAGDGGNLGDRAASPGCVPGVVPQTWEAPTSPPVVGRRTGSRAVLGPDLDCKWPNDCCCKTPRLRGSWQR